MELHSAQLSKLISQTDFDGNLVLNSTAERSACCELLSKTYGGRPPISMVRFVLSNPAYDKENGLILLVYF